MHSNLGYCDAGLGFNLNQPAPMDMDTDTDMLDLNAPATVSAAKEEEVHQETQSFFQGPQTKKSKNRANNEKKDYASKKKLLFEKLAFFEARGFNADKSRFATIVDKDRKNYFNLLKRMDKRQLLSEEEKQRLEYIEGNMNALEQVMKDDEKLLQLSLLSTGGNYDQFEEERKKNPLEKVKDRIDADFSKFDPNKLQRNNHFDFERMAQVPTIQGTVTDRPKSSEPEGFIQFL